MASRLQEQGEEIAWLGLIQAMTDYSIFKKLSIGRRLIAHAANLRRSGWRYIHDRIERRRRKAEYSPQALIAHHSYRFQCQPFTGRLHLFRLMEVVPFIEPELGWKGMATDGIEFHDLTGTWTSMFESPHVERLVSAMQASLPSFETE